MNDPTGTSVPKFVAPPSDFDYLVEAGVITSKQLDGTDCVVCGWTLGNNGKTIDSPIGTLYVCAGPHYGVTDKNPDDTPTAEVRPLRPVSPARCPSWCRDADQANHWTGEDCMSDELNVPATGGEWVLADTSAKFGRTEVYVQYADSPCVHLTVFDPEQESAEHAHAGWLAARMMPQEARRLSAFLEAAADVADGRIAILPAQRKSVA